MQKKVKRKIIISVVSGIIIFILADMIVWLTEVVEQWIPVLKRDYFIFEGVYVFFLYACYGVIAFIILLNLFIWFYDKIFKD